MQFPTIHAGTRVNRHPSTSGREGTRTGDRQAHSKTRASLWTIQSLLALLFLFAGSMKLVMPADTLAEQSDLPVLFMRFIGLCELLGAGGLVLPGLFRIRPGLTPLAALGLVIIMIGATVVTIAIGDGAAAAMPAGIGVLTAFVAYGRLHIAPHRTRAH